MRKSGFSATVVALVLAGAALGAAERPTLAAEPAIATYELGTTLSGTVPNGGAGELVRIEARDCNSSFWRVYDAATTGPGGTWRLPTESSKTVNGQELGITLQASTAFRAVWRDMASNVVSVQLRIRVAIWKRPNGRFFVVTQTPFQNMHGRFARLERLGSNGWVLVRRAKLSRIDRETAVAGFRFRTRGVRLRGVVDDANARPCYAPAVSAIVRS